MTPVLLLEINEVPWRLIDHYRDDARLPNLKRFFAGSHQHSTHAVDVGQLSPWVTWPTIHRGMNNEAHGVLHLGQDPTTFRGKPIWQDVRERGGTIGICGSLQSWPPLDPGPGGFFVPDTFAHDARCIPRHVEPIQALNLSMVRGNARVVNPALPPLRRALGLVGSALRSGVRVRTMARIARQLSQERLDAFALGRRPIFQAILFWDVFRALFDPRRPPALSTFFTNHVAGVMHRYWHSVFPEDFAPGRRERGRSHEPLMAFALVTLDGMLGEVMAWCRANPRLVVVFASSMGQGAVHRDEHEGMELVVDDLARLLSHAQLGRTQYQPLLAMVPQVAARVPDARARAGARARLEAMRCADGTAFVTVQESGDSLSITVRTPPRHAVESGDLVIDGRPVRWADSGIRVQDVDAGTGYHVPEGSLAIYAGSGYEAPDHSRRMIPADQLKAWLLEIIERDRIEIGAAH